MKPSRFLPVYLLLLCCLLMGCSASTTAPELIPTDTSAPEVAAPTETATVMPATPAPTDTATPVPPTLPPTEEPTPEPSPTRTPIPLGTFRGCTYYNGKLVGNSGFKINDSSYEQIAEPNVKAMSGCASRQLPAGVYYVNAFSTGHPDCEPGPAEFCASLENPIEIVAGKVTEVDFQLEAPD